MRVAGIGWEGSSARRIDPPDLPGTAWDKAVEKAAKVRPPLTPTQREVYALFVEHKTMADPEMVSKARMRYITQSESGLRTRRSELVKRGLVVDTGKRASLPSGRRARVWRVG